MRLDCPRFKNTLDKSLKKIKNDLELGMTPSAVLLNLCMLTSVPLAVCASYMLRPEVCGPNAELEQTLKRLIEFYGYTEIVPFD
jgi:hypothetical protein